VGRRIDEAIERIELELRHAAAYVNDAVIPQVRVESISALRTVADSLRKFADTLEKPNKPPQPPGSPQS
jgi:predicted transcriptional regulator